jgi:NADH-quinone oxidoreductase subunit A
MTSSYLIDFVYMAVITMVAIFFILQLLMASKFFAPRNPNPIKLEPYECGNISLGEPWIRFHVGYYVFALLFLVFDIETVFLFPWAVVFRGAGLVALIELALFIGILVFALFYAWKKGVLKWT